MLTSIELLIQRDPGQRGLLGRGEQNSSLCPDHFEEAARDLAESATHVVLVTGFFIPHAEIPAAETDGPPGAVYLAQALIYKGVRVTLITDSLCYSTLSSCVRQARLPESVLLTFPETEPEAWIEDFYARGSGREMSHLIAIERVGPSHTRESLLEQSREEIVPLEQFQKLVPLQKQDQCHNMRGMSIESHSAPLHRLFEELPRYHPDAKTLGVGDGGNEIGMGNIPWEVLHERLGDKSTAHIPCRIKTDWTIISGTSNWGALALAASFLHLNELTDLLEEWTSDHHREMLEHLVQHGPAVDGVTGKQEPTVDGLPFLTYIQPWLMIRQLLLSR